MSNPLDPSAEVPNRGMCDCYILVGTCLVFPYIHLQAVSISSCTTDLEDLDFSTSVFLSDILSENYPPFEFYNYLINSQMLRRIIIFFVCIILSVKNSLYFP